MCYVNIYKKWCNSLTQLVRVLSLQERSREFESHKGYKIIVYTDHSLKGKISVLGILVVSSNLADLRG